MAIFVIKRVRNLSGPAYARAEPHARMKPASNMMSGDMKEKPSPSLKDFDTEESKENAIGEEVSII